MNIKALSGADLARCFDVDRSMVTRWKKAGMPHENGVFSLSACIKWRLEQEAEAMSPKRPASEEGERALTRFRWERARMAKLERLKLQGSLIAKADIIGEWVLVYGEFRQDSLALPNKLPPLLEGKTPNEMEPVIKEHVYAMLTALARPGIHRPSPIEKTNEEKKK